MKFYYLAMAIFAILSGACLAEDSVRELDQGFGDKLVAPDGIMIHSNANLSGMFEAGLAYNYVVYEDGRIEKWSPNGADTRITDYGNDWVAYHGGKGVFPGETNVTNLNVRTIGIGLAYGANQTASRVQMEALANLSEKLRQSYPPRGNYSGIAAIFGQNVSAYYRMQNVTIETDCGTRTNGKDLLLFNPWNYSPERLVTTLDSESWVLVKGSSTRLNETSNCVESWPIMYVAKKKKGVDTI